MISVGVLGGTFDPIHNGHLYVAQSALDQLGFDRVLFTVANDPWQKSSLRSITPAALRLAMCRAALVGHDKMLADDREIRRGGPSYSIDTVTELLAENDDAQISLIVGADVVGSLPTWHRAAELAQLVDIVVVNRGVGARQGLPEGWSVKSLTIAPMDVSATEIRARVARDQVVDDLVAPGVAKIIGDAGLYAGTPHDKSST